MTRNRLTRTDYADRPLATLRSLLASVQDRMARADTTEAALADLFDEQELQAAIEAKQVAWQNGATPEAIG